MTSEEDSRIRPLVDLPAVGQMQYTRLSDAIEHAMEEAVTTEERSNLNDLLFYIHNESERVEGVDDDE